MKNSGSNNTTTAVPAKRRRTRSGGIADRETLPQFKSKLPSDPIAEKFIDSLAKHMNILSSSPLTFPTPIENADLKDLFGKAVASIPDNAASLKECLKKYSSYYTNMLQKKLAERQLQDLNSTTSKSDCALGEISTVNGSANSRGGSSLVDIRATVTNTSADFSDQSLLTLMRYLMDSVANSLNDTDVSLLKDSWHNIICVIHFRRTTFPKNTYSNPPSMVLFEEDSRATYEDYMAAIISQYTEIVVRASSQNNESDTLISIVQLCLSHSHAHILDMLLQIDVQALAKATTEKKMSTLLPLFRHFVPNIIVRNNLTKKDFAKALLCVRVAYFDLKLDVHIVEDIRKVTLSLPDGFSDWLQNGIQGGSPVENYDSALDLVFSNDFDPDVLMDMICSVGTSIDDLKAKSDDADKGQDHIVDDKEIFFVDDKGS